MNIQFCLVQPLAGSAGVVTPAAGPVTIIAITRSNRCAVHPFPRFAIFPCVALPSDITRNMIKQVELIEAAATAKCICVFLF